MTSPRYSCARPALLTGTSGEYLGKRPLPRIVRERPNVVLLGSAGVGKTTVAHFLGGPEARYLDKHGTQNELVNHVRTGRWSERLLTAPSLILDGPVWLDHRPAVVRALRELVDSRQKQGLRTLIVQDPGGGTVHPIIADRAPGSTVTIGLRFPVGRSRKRYVRQQLAELDLPRELGHGLSSLPGWSYQRVRDELERRQSEALVGAV